MNLWELSYERLFNMGIFLKIKEVFTKEYKEETEYREFMESNINNFRLESDNYNANESIESLKISNFKNNFKVSPEQLSTTSINTHEEQSLNFLQEER